MDFLDKSKAICKPREVNIVKVIIDHTLGLDLPPKPRLTTERTVVAPSAVLAGTSPPWN